MLWLRTIYVKCLANKYNVHYWNQLGSGILRNIGRRMVRIIVENTISSANYQTVGSSLGTTAIFRSGLPAFRRNRWCSPAPFEDHIWCCWWKSIWMRPANVRMICGPPSMLWWLFKWLPSIFGWKSWFFCFINSLHIYSNQFEQAQNCFVVTRQTINHVWCEWPDRTVLWYKAKIWVDALCPVKYVEVWPSYLILLENLFKPVSVASSTTQNHVLSWFQIDLITTSGSTEQCASCQFYQYRRIEKLRQ